MVTGLVDYLNTFLDYLENHFRKSSLMGTTAAFMRSKMQEKNNNIVKYYYILKYLFYFKM